MTMGTLSPLVQTSTYLVMTTLSSLCRKENGEMGNEGDGDHGHAIPFLEMEEMVVMTFLQPRVAN